jgi:hypothetical protein
MKDVIYDDVIRRSKGFRGQSSFTVNMSDIN